MESFVLLLNGFTSWYVTGLDDLLLLGGMIVIARENRRTTAVFAGQLIAVLVVLFVTNLLVFVIQALSFKTSYLSIISGGILVIVGILLFRSSSQSKEKDERPTIRKSWWLTALGASVVYWLNSIDDVTVASGMFLPLPIGSRLVFSAGFLTGWMTSFMLAWNGSKIKKPWLSKLLVALLILWGLVSLGNGLFGTP